MEEYKNIIIDFFQQHQGYLKKNALQAQQAIIAKTGIFVPISEIEPVKSLIRRNKDNLKREINQISEKPKILLFDLETSPNLVFSWNIGYNLNISPENIVKERAIICVSYKWLGSGKVNTISWNNGDDYKLCQEFAKIISEADAVIGHNSDKYDNKFLFQRLIFHDIKVKNSYKRIDTLKMARKYFRFNSNKLDYLGQYLGLGKKLHTTYSLWTDIVLYNNKKALQDMITYCEQDVNLLEKVYNKLKEYDKRK